jgi:hypothetical protein
VVRHDVAHPVSQNQKYGIEPEDAAAEVLRLYGAGYEKKIGEPYAFRPNAGSQATDLLKTASLNQIRRVIAAFYDFGADDWFQREGYPFAAFCKQFEKLAAKADRAAAEEKHERPSVMGVEATDAYLRKLHSGKRASPETVRAALASTRTRIAARNGGAH